MAKSRKTTRKTARKKPRRTAAKKAGAKTRKSAAKRTGSRRGGGVVRGTGARKTAKRKAPRRKPANEGVVASAYHTVVDSAKDAAELRQRMAGTQTFED